jgi:hypothetical protein
MAVNISQFFESGSGLINLGGGDIDDFMTGKGGDLIRLLVNVSGIVAVIMLIVGGYIFITSGGDSEKVASGQKTLTAAIIGLVIVLLARVLIYFVLDAF